MQKTLAIPDINPLLQFMISNVFQVFEHAMAVCLSDGDCSVRVSVSFISVCLFSCVGLC